jgi:CBS domain-containing protein
MELRSDRPLRVEDAAVPVQYRVYPETPLAEVIDLMVRRDVRALPVVGERYEVLGIITSGDALGRVLKESPADDSVDGGAQPLLVRDVMTRAVLCVSESQPLTEAGRMMVNRKVEQLPVVRDGELVGLITRDAVLRALHGGGPDNDNPNKAEQS